MDLFKEVYEAGIPGEARVMGQEIGGDVGGAGARRPGLDATVGCLDFILNVMDGPWRGKTGE